MNKMKIYIILLLFFLLTFPANAFIKIQGQDFVDENGNKVFFKGIGLGGWLMPEGYMLHIPGFGSPTSIREMITKLIGEENTNEFYSIYEENYVNEVDIQKIAELGFNSVRLPFNHRLLSPEGQPSVILESGFQVIDTFIEWCKKYNLYVILDMHAAPGGQNDGNISDSDGVLARLWTEKKNQDHTVVIWKKIAERYADEPIIVGYDLINEPVLPSGYTNLDLKNLYKRITEEIRKVDTNHIIFIEGNTYATNFNSLAPPWDDNMSYSFHKYWNTTDKASIQNYLSLRQQTDVPLWMGESGENSNPWFHAAINTLEDNNIGWCWWTHKKIQTTTSPYSANITDGYQHVLDYWNGNRSKPSVEFAKNALFEMAENLALDSCRYLPDVVAAIFSDDFDRNPIPYKELKVPGIIACVDYDIGNVNIAYSDKEYQKTHWDRDEPWNNGWQYRNDGVDIEVSNDNEGSPYSVGWTETGEWLSYTVNVAYTGIYDINFRVAVNSDNAKLQLLLDNDQLTPVLDLPNSGGWYNWQTYGFKDAQLQAGVHKLTFKITSEGFNINQMEFVLVKADPSALDGPVFPGQFQLGQNFPNPFNGTTKIPFKLEGNSAANISIYDISGRLVKKLRKTTVPGIYDSVEWDGTDMRDIKIGSGVYLYRLSGDKYETVKKMILLQ
ncbi:cellulase family glycosylhydrolase [candidate division KSB1 bacterium]|nr:cellulase family glycosylhydrolase [candidate division KSB1 bacterium]